MGRIVNSTFVSLDGVINHMDRWHFDFVDGESDNLALRQLEAADSMLMGRKTYEAYAAVWPTRDGEYPDRINELPKYVASTSLAAPEWANTSVISGDLVAAVTELRQDHSILMHGYGPVAKMLMREGLIDELHLWVHPVLAGTGGPEDLLLSDGLNRVLGLDDVTKLDSGVVVLSYRAS